MIWNNVFKTVPCGEPRVLSSYCTGSEVVGLTTLELLGLVSLLSSLDFRNILVSQVLGAFLLPSGITVSVWGENHIPQSVCAKISVGKGEEWVSGLERMLSREGSASPSTKGHLHHEMERSRQIQAPGDSVR